MLRRQLPAYSPVTAEALLAAVAAIGRRLFSFSADLGTADVYQQVLETLTRHFCARALFLADSGTSALQIALRATLSDRPGAPVALPAYCCYDVATAAAGAGVPVVLYDVAAHTLAPDLPSLEQALDRGARAIVVAHLYGMPVDIRPIRERAAQAGAIVIEDAAQGIGAAIGNAPVGTIGSLSILSFGRGKGLSTGGGGAVLATDDLGARALPSPDLRRGEYPAGWRELVRLFGQWLMGRPAVYGIPAAVPFFHLGEAVYRRPREPGSLSAVAARVLSVTWAVALQEAETRRRNAARLSEYVSTSRLIPIEPVAHARPGYLRFPVLVPPGEPLEAIPYRHGVARGYPRSLGELPQLSGISRNGMAELPGARALAGRLYTLPTHSRVSEPDLAVLRAWIAGRA